jgi:hypothetical protein
MPRSDLQQTLKQRLLRRGVDHGPGPLMSVMRPSCSATLMLLRVSPGTRMNASTKPRLANRVSKACRLSSPRKPLTVS